MQEDLIIYRTAAASSRYLNSVDIPTNTKPKLTVRTYDALFLEIIATMSPLSSK
ncbi:hypothetical protein ALC60_13127 [Trachymyrmex zeteki]|uniref:Uncharacterized protein n=1 Tax=Mycetomoellerius zeteki TaxID=64791 RepID=A0A151WJ56_9HYME|nr:hypothetical protein ALC60_13127 [Trachymyrmex zeteki]